MIVDLPEGYIIVKKTDYEFLLAKVMELTLRVQELESKLTKNSSNSHKPPSSDGYKKVIKNNREKTDKKQGAQPGNEGKTLKQRSNPDKIVSHKITGYCACGKDLEVLPVTNINRRQVFDLPEQLLEVTEHQVAVKQCVCGIRHEASCPVRGITQLV